MPFQNMTSEKWQNLAFGSLLVLYLVQIALDIVWHNTFGNLGIDFASYWSAGFIANHYGYAKVYDLVLLKQVQFPLFPKAANPEFLHVVPMPYLAVFLIPFQLLSLFEPATAFWIWTTINILVVVFYLRYFIIQTTGQTPTKRLLAMVLVSAPVFLTLFLGQANVWLLICVGEFLRNAMAGKPLRSGLWLGGLLLKPQCLMILVPALLLQRSVKALTGLAASSAAISGCSLLLGGLQSLLPLVKLWLGYAGGLPTNDVQLMMNWRMAGVALGHLIAAPAALAIAISGTIITFLAAMYLWMRPLKPNSAEFLIAVTGSLAATEAVAWHAHVHMAILILPALLALYLTQEQLFHNKLEWWVFLPAGLYVLRLLLGSLMHASILAPSANDLIDLLNGIGLFALNLYFLGWAIKHTRAATSALAPITSA